MPSRRAPRWVYWPAKAFWAPSILVGLPLMMHVAPQVDKVSDGGWRVLVSLTTPDRWVQHMETFVPGLLLFIVGIILFFFYQADSGPGRALTAIEYPLFSWAAWIFGITAALSVWRTTGHVADVGAAGIDWRFLAYLRSEPLDYVVTGAAAFACAVCWLTSWSFVSGRWAGADAV